MSQFLHSKLCFYIGIGIICCIAFIQADHYFGYTSKTPKDPVNICVDGTGYYAYLPQYFTYSDQGYTYFEALNKTYPNKKFSYSIKSTPGGKSYNKYYLGTAIAISPFYLVAQLHSKVFGYPVDGYSIVYRFFLQLAALFYFIVGCSAIRNLLSRYGIKNGVILLSVIIVTLGSNLNYYLAFWVGYSHIYSFGLIALFINVADLFARTKKEKYFLYLCAIFGLLIIIRPTNAIIFLLVPFLFSSRKEFWQTVFSFFREKIFIVLLGGALFILPLSLFIVERMVSQGSFSLYSYNGEGFDNWLTPQIFNVLFSFKKGLFIYAPALLLLFFGLPKFRKHFSKRFVIGFAITTLLFLYVISSWWSWDYGGGLGMRAMIEWMPLLIIPIAIFFSTTSKMKFFGGLLFALFGIFLYQIYQIQMKKDIIHHSDMNYAKFKTIFLKTANRYKFIFHYNYNEIPPSFQLGKKNATVQYTKDGWHRLANDTAFYHFRKDAVTLLSPSPHSAGKFTAIIKLGNQANNPFIDAFYYSNGEIIYKNRQPFGNKIKKLHIPTKVRINFYPSKEVLNQTDSIRFYFHKARGNTYKNAKLTWHELLKD